MGFDQGQLREGVSCILTIAGQRPVDAAGELLHDDDVAAQLALAMANLAAVVEEAGLCLTDLAQLRVTTTDLAAVMELHDVVTELLAPHGATPPITVAEVRRLAHPLQIVEIDGLAVA